MRVTEAERRFNLGVSQGLDIAANLLMEKALSNFSLRSDSGDYIARSMRDVAFELKKKIKEIDDKYTIKVTP